VVAGTGGWVEVKPRFHRAEVLSVNLRGQEPREVVLPRTGVGYCHELIHVGECLAAGLTESPVMPLADTLAVQQVMARVLEQLG
jgi:hypothetical protein